MANQQGTRARLIQAGFDLFFQRGYNATGVGEIVAAIGVPKGSFYSYFPSKDALACAVIDDFRARSIEHFSHLSATSGSPISCLRTHFNELRKTVVNNNFSGGCLLGNFSAEMVDQSDTIRTHVAAAFDTWQTAIGELIEQAQARHEIPRTSDPAETAAVLLNSFEGAILRARADQSAAPFDQFERVFELLLGAKMAHARSAARK